jgi:hypothetical protein
MILYLALTTGGSNATPPLAIVDPTKSVRRSDAVPVPGKIIHVPTGCTAVVQTAADAFYVVNGATREAFLLDLMNPADDWKYDGLANRDHRDSDPGRVSFQQPPILAVVPPFRGCIHKSLNLVLTWIDRDVEASRSAGKAIDRWETLRAALNGRSSRRCTQSQHPLAAQAAKSGHN